MSLRQSAALSLIWAGLESGAATVLSTCSLFVMAHIVGPTDFGVVALALGIIAMANSFGEYLFQDALVQREDLTEAHERTAHTTAMALGLVLFGGCALAATPLGWLFRSPDFPLVFIICSSILPLSSLIAVPTARLRRNFDFKTLALRTIAARVTGAIIGPVLVLLGFGLWSFVAQHLVSCWLSIALVLRASPARIKPGFDRTSFRELFAFGAPKVLSVLVQSMVTRSFTVLVGTLLDTRAVGLVEMTFRLVDTLRWMIFDAGHRVGMSTFSRLQADRRALLRSYGDNTRFMALFAHPALVGLAVAAPELVPVLLGAQWTAAIPLVQTMALTAVVQSIVYRSEVVANALGKPTLVGFFFAGVLAVMVGGMLVIRPSSPFAALAIWMVAMLGLAPIWVVMVCRLTGWTALELLSPGSRALGAAAAMAAVVLACDHLLLGELGLVTRLAANVALGVASYAAVTLMLNRQAVVELRGLLRRDHAQAA
jgi:PST family polysaccharide transporter